jgi:hypothetical protein
LARAWTEGAVIAARVEAEQGERDLEVLPVDDGQA